MILKGDPTGDISTLDVKDDPNLKVLSRIAANNFPTYLGEAPNSCPGLQAKAPKARFIPSSPFMAGSWLRICSGAAFIESLEDVKISMAHVGRRSSNFN